MELSGTKRKRERKRGGGGGDWREGMWLERFFWDGKLEATVTVHEKIIDASRACPYLPLSTRSLTELTRSHFLFFSLLLITLSELSCSEYNPAKLF